MVVWKMTKIAGQYIPRLKNEEDEEWGYFRSEPFETLEEARSFVFKIIASLKIIELDSNAALLKN